MESISFQIHGKPATKGSLTRMRNGSYLPAGTKASRMNYDLWAGNVASAARVEMGGKPPWEGAIRLMAEFQLAAPATVKKYEWGWLPHITRPDSDKLTRALLDPMTGIVWKDDSQVCFSTINKVYAWNRRPGAFCVIDFLDNQWCESYSTVHREITNVIDSL